MNYKTISNACNSELIIKKSRFICILSPLNELQEVEVRLHEAKQRYPGANHYCFAHRIRHDSKTLERCSDDGEPSGTAGWPMLNVLKQKELENVIAVVIRYFGGTLLGTGGLVRAYTQSVQSAMDTSHIITMEYSQKISVTLDYNYCGSFEKQFFSFIKVSDITYTDHVRVELWISADKTADFMSRVNNLTLGTAKIENLGKDYVAK